MDASSRDLEDSTKCGVCEAIWNFLSSSNRVSRAALESERIRDMHTVFDKRSGEIPTVGLYTALDSGEAY